MIQFSSIYFIVIVLINDEEHFNLPLAHIKATFSNFYFFRFKQNKKKTHQQSCPWSHQPPVKPSTWTRSVRVFSLLFRSAVKLSETLFLKKKRSRIKRTSPTLSPKRTRESSTFWSSLLRKNIQLTSKTESTSFTPKIVHFCRA